MSDNLDIARRFIRIWGDGDLGLIDELASSDIVVRYPVMPSVIRGRRLYRRVMEGFRGAFPDASLEVLEEVDGGDRVVLRWSFSGTHSGPLLGIPASGKKVSWTGMTLYLIRGGLVAEETGEENFLDFYRQIGMVE